MLTIDGSQGEGGGQILRTSLSLSVCSGQPVQFQNIRARRPKPGLGRQHLKAVQAATQICQAKVRGASLGSQSLEFRPKRIRPGNYEFRITTAGSAMLVLQTVLPPLLLASGPSRVVFEGGTHNPIAPPFDFIADSFLPLINQLGGHVEATLIRPGFYPAGGGRAEVSITPITEFRPLSVLTRGALLKRCAVAYVSGLPVHIAERELAELRALLNWPAENAQVVEVADPPGRGNALSVSVTFQNITATFVTLGERARPAEQVAADAAREVTSYLESDYPVGEHLADQLLLPLALAAQQGISSCYRTGPLSSHTTTNIQTIQKFLDLSISATAVSSESQTGTDTPKPLWEISVRPS